MRLNLILVTVLHALIAVVAVAGAPPRLLDDRLQIELFAEAPEIVTPIGICFDHQNRLLVIESHTHHRRADYVGPAKDRIRIITDKDGDGRADSFETFFEGTEFTMSLARGPADWIYVATRHKVFRIRDSDNDDRADVVEPIAQLETKGVYPHNGLSGLMLDGKGSLYFGMGENLGFDYRLVGRDGRFQQGSGEGGIFRCDLQGNQLMRVATGFWNPFGICKDPMGRIFAVGNDSDGRPPCRLVHVFDAADYGFQFRYGRSGRHPLQAWDGELPGTLPMVAGTGEAPCEMLAYQGRLWVASWGDNQIERYQLTPHGASFLAQRDVAIQGDKTFRPVGMAVSHDKWLYISDWVDRSYPVHGSGRIWRVRFNDQHQQELFPPLANVEIHARRAARSIDWAALKSADAFLRQAAIAGLAKDSRLANLDISDYDDPLHRQAILQALRWRFDHSRGEPDSPPVDTLKTALADSDPDVRWMAVRWVADVEIQPLRDAVERQLKRHDNVTPGLFLGTLACLEVLDHGNRGFNSRQIVKRLMPLLAGGTLPPKLTAVALRSLPPDGQEVDLSVIEALTLHDDQIVQREAVRFLALSNLPGRLEILRKILLSQDIPDSVRADGALGFHGEDSVDALLDSLPAEDHPVRRELARAVAASSESEIRGDSRPSEDQLDAWMNKVGQGGDPSVGWRVFFRTGSARCANCHQYQGRGTKLGPDLTAIAASSSRREVLKSILQPSRDLAPKYVPMRLETKDGRVLTGLHDGYDRYLGSDGLPFQLKESDIEFKSMSDVSIMPEGIHKLLTVDDLRDLLALLQEPS